MSNIQRLYDKWKHSSDPAIKYHVNRLYYSYLEKEMEMLDAEVAGRTKRIGDSIMSGLDRAIELLDEITIRGK